jgi:hypothetical protein
MKTTLLGGFADFALGALAALLAVVAVLGYLVLYGYDPSKFPDPPKRRRPTAPHPKDVPPTQ